MKVITHSVATEQRNSITQYLLPGNITPHSWYKKFCDENGKPDLLAITTFSDVLAWCRNGTNEYYGEHMPNFDGTSLSVSYDYFQEKFGFSKASIRRAIVRLEKFGVLKRTIHNIKVSPEIRVNRMFLTIDQDFFNSCFRDPSLDIRAGQGTAYAGGKNSDIQIDDNIFPATPSLQICTDPISNKNIKKDRSMKSNFLQNSFFKKGKGDLRIKHHYFPAPLQLKAPVLQLKDFYPLSESDAKSLQSRSGREFSSNAMNEILLDMSKRVKDRWFKSKKGFLSYMSLVFKHEMRDAVKVNTESFKIRANQTPEEITARAQEEFLSQIEYSLQVSPEWHLKKKLCAVLEREKAYNLLSSYKHCRLDGDTFEIHITKNVELTNMDREIILNQVKASHESADLVTGNFVSISNLKIVTPVQIAKTRAIQAVGEVHVKDTTGATFETLGIWGKIRKALIMYHGEKGEALDQAWFSKLMPEIDENKRIILLKAPTEFIKDWISSNYKQVLERCSREYQYSYVIY
jgi:hypothetical protein